MSGMTEATRLNARRAAARVGRLLCGVAACAGMASVAYAEVQPAANSDGEILVTANKRSERLIDVPAPVTALGADQLTRTQAVRLEDFAAQVPGLNLIANRPGETQIVLRGITTGSPISSTVAIYVDDTPYGSSTSQALGGFLNPDLDPSDVERIEVLRGPQGTLYGASALGGLLKYVSKSPDLGKVAGRIELGGNAVAKGGDGYSVRGMINVPIINDTLALRVSGYKRRDAGFIDDTQLGVNNINKTDIYGGRAALLWRPTDQLSIDLTATLQNLNGDGSSEEDIILTGRKVTARTGDLEHARFTFEPRTVRYRLYGGTINYDLGGVRFVSVTSHSTLVQHGITDQTYQSGALLGALLGAPGVGFSVGSDIDLSKFTQEVRLESDTSGPLEWRIGAYFTHERVNRHQPSRAFFYANQSTIPLPAPVYFADLYSKYTEYAGFADVTYHLTDSLSLSGGLRYSTNDQGYHQTTGGLAVGPTTSLANTSSDNSVTYQVSAKYKINDDNMLYARVASGYRPGGPNALTPALAAAGVPAEFGPDTLTNYDIGYKASLLDRKLTLDISAFYIDWKDIQILTNFGGFTSAGNGGTARSYGFEASAAWKPVRGLNLSANVAYTDATLTKDAPGVNGFDGDRLPSVPKWAGGLSADYDFPLSAKVGAFVGGGLHAVGARRAGFITGSPATFSRPTMPSYTTVDLRTGVELGGYSLTVYAKNVGDKRGLNYITSLNGNSYSAPFTASVIQPRTIGVSFVANF